MTMINMMTTNITVMMTTLTMNVMMTMIMMIRRRMVSDHLKLKAPYKDASRTWMRKQGETMIPGDAGFLTLGVSLMSFTPLHSPTNCFDFLYVTCVYLSCFGVAFCKKKRSPKNSSRSMLKHES